MRNYFLKVYLCFMYLLITKILHMKIGYARVSTCEQELGLQITSLKNAGCDKIYQEKESAVKERPVLKEVMLMLREGDVLVVWKLDRLARSLKQLILFLEELRTRKIEFLSLSDNINSLSAQSILYTQIIGAFAQFERELMIERTLAGLEDAKRRGVKLGRRPGLTEDAKIKADAVAKLYSNGMQVLEICKILQISRGTFYRYLKYNNINLRLTRNDE